MSNHFIKSQQSAKRALKKHQETLNLALSALDRNSEAALKNAPDDLKAAMQGFTLRIAAIAKRAAKGENVEQELKILKEQAKNLHNGSTGKK